MKKDLREWQVERMEVEVEPPLLGLPQDDETIGATAFRDRVVVSVGREGKTAHFTLRLGGAQHLATCLAEAIKAAERTAHEQ